MPYIQQKRLIDFLLVKVNGTKKLQIWNGYNVLCFLQDVFKIHQIDNLWCLAFVGEFIAYPKCINLWHTCIHLLSEDTNHKEKSDFKPSRQVHALTCIYMTFCMKEIATCSELAKYATQATWGIQCTSLSHRELVSVLHTFFFLQW